MWIIELYYFCLGALAIVLGLAGLYKKVEKEKAKKKIK
jgi:hypothetical protein